MALPVNVGDLVVVDYGQGPPPADPPRLILSIRPAGATVNSLITFAGPPTPPSVTRWEVEYFHPKEQIKGYMSVYEIDGGGQYPKLTLYSPEEEIKEEK